MKCFLFQWFTIALDPANLPPLGSAKVFKDLAENLQRYKVSDQAWTGYQMAADL